MIPTVNIQKISNDVKGIIEDIINEKYDKRQYEKLTLNKTRLIKRLVTALNRILTFMKKAMKNISAIFKLLFANLNARSLIR